MINHKDMGMSQEQHEEENFKLTAIKILNPVQVYSKQFFAKLKDKNSLKNFDILEFGEGTITLVMKMIWAGGSMMVEYIKYLL